MSIHTLIAFLRWWSRQLASIAIGERGLVAQALGNGVLIDVASSGTPQLIRRRGGRETTLGPLGANVAARYLGKGEIVLRVGPGQLLEREVSLPLTAEARLGEILALDIDRLTPFTAGEVWWNHAVTARDLVRGRLSVRLSMLPRIAPLVRLGLAPSAIAVPGLGGDWRVVRLRPAARRGGFEGFALRGLAVLCALLALAAAVIPFAQQELRLAAAEETIATLRPQVAEAEVLRRELASAQDSEAALANAGGAVARRLAVIATLAAALPDDTFLTELSLRGTALELRGQSRAAARLVGLLSDEPGLQAVGFAAPLTRAEAEAVDLFALRATVKP